MRGVKIYIYIFPLCFSPSSHYALHSFPCVPPLFLLTMHSTHSLVFHSHFLLTMHSTHSLVFPLSLSSHYALHSFIPLCSTLTFFSLCTPLIHSLVFHSPFLLTMHSTHSFPCVPPLFLLHGYSIAASSTPTAFFY